MKRENIKKNTLFIPVLAALMWAGCSHDESAITESEASYLAVNIVTPKTIIGRTATSDGFEDGSGSENKADEGLFLFFDEKGNATQIPQKVGFKWSANTSSKDPAVEKISEAVLVIAGNTPPTQLLVILNAPSDLEVSDKTLAEVREVVDNYAATFSGENELNPLVITNSTYCSDTGQEVCATDIRGVTYKSESEAKEHAVNVYVERVVAKVRTSRIGDNFTKGAAITVDGKEVTLTPTIEGIEIANIAEKSYLFKSIAGSESWDWSKNFWNDPGNRRSYWATCPEGLTYANQSWNEIDKVDPAASHEFYVQENTSETKSCVLVTATLKDGDGNPYDFVRWAGSYYTPANFKNMYCALLQNAGFGVKEEVEGTGTKIRSIVSTDIEYLSDQEHAEKVASRKLKGYETTVKLTGEAEKLQFVQNERDCSAGDVNDFLFKKENLVWYWKGGKAYYFANIEHFGEPAPFNEGVVRNHLYDLTLSSLQGVGVAVFNPDEKIIPERPSDDLYYLAAKINILKWRLVKQQVNFD